MRLFVAVELPEAVARAAAEAGRQLRDRASRQAPRARITWVAPERMHLTLRFLGELDGAAAGRVQQVLADPLAVSPFTLSLTEVGTFPPRGAPRVIWLGLGRGRAELLAAEHEISERLRQLGIPPEERPFSPHLTVARVREADGLRSAPLLDAIAVAADATGVVDAITLFESRLSPKGPAYTALQRTPLRRDSQGRVS